MSTQSPPGIVGCLLDVSNSMREAMETGHSNQPATDRLRAVLQAAFQLAQAEQERSPHALMFVGVFGLDRDPNCVDLCGLVEALLEGHDGHHTGHDLLISLANQNNLWQTTNYIRTKLTNQEARIVYAYLRRHPEGIQEFVDALPGLMGTAALNITSNMYPTGLGAILGIPNPEDVAVENSKALKLARQICDDWLKDFVDFKARPIRDVLQLLQQLQTQTKNDSSNENGSNGDKLLEAIRQYLYGWTPVTSALRRALATFRENSEARERLLVLLSDGKSTDGDPGPIAEELRKENVSLATIFLTSDRNIPERRVYDRVEHMKQCRDGQRTLFTMASKIAVGTHPIPVLTSLGWQVPSSGECGLYVAVCSTTVLEEFCQALLSARFGSADALLDIVGRVKIGKYINDTNVSVC